MQRLINAFYFCCMTRINVLSFEHKVMQRPGLAFWLSPATRLQRSKSITDGFAVLFSGGDWMDNSGGDTASGGVV